MRFWGRTECQTSRSISSYYHKAFKAPEREQLPGAFSCFVYHRWQCLEEAAEALWKLRVSTSWLLLQDGAMSLDPLHQSPCFPYLQPCPRSRKTGTCGGSPWMPTHWRRWVWGVEVRNREYPTIAKTLGCYQHWFGHKSKTQYHTGCFEEN